MVGSLYRKNYRETGELIQPSDAPSLSSYLLDHPDPYKPFLPLLTYSSNPEDPIPLLTSSVLASLISTAQMKFPKSTPKTDEALPKLYKYLAGLTKSQDSGLQDIAVQAYSTVLRTKKSRELFWKQRDETITPLMDILRAAAGAGKDTDSTLWSGGASVRSATEAGLGGGVGLQLLYHVLLVIWQLSFEGSLIGKELEKWVSPIHCSYTLLISISENTRSSLYTHISYASRQKKRQPACFFLQSSTSSHPAPTAPSSSQSQCLSAYQTSFRTSKAAILPTPTFWRILKH